MRPLPCACAVACLVATLGAAEPLPKDADDAHLARGWDARVHAWNRATMVDAYGAVGAHDARWDDAAVACLGDWATWFSALSRTPIAQLTSEADLAIGLGCDDPLVAYLAGRGRQTARKPAEAVPYYERALAGFATHAYAPVRSTMCRRRLLECRVAALGGEPEHLPQSALAPLEPLVDEAIAGEVAMVGDRAYAGIERLLYEQLGDTRYPVAAWQERRDAALEQACAGAGVDPWFAKTWLGARHIALAWRARGSGWASTVSDDGWKGFASHLDQARVLLEEAARLDPNDPIAPTLMLKVVMGRGGDLRGWFDRAVRASFDYVPAYEALRYAQSPRWGGSYEQMLALGEECVATGRFDTQVPWQCLATVYEILVENRTEPKQVLSRPGVNAALHRVFDGYIPVAERDHDARRAAWLRSLAIAVDYGAGRVEEARKEWQALGTAFHPEAFDWLFLDLKAALAEFAAGPAPEGPPDF